MGKMNLDQVIEAPKSQYMNEGMQAYFRDFLNEQKCALLEAMDADMTSIAGGEVTLDVVDRATSEESTFMNLRHLERRTKLLRKIEAALMRLEDGSFGYCELTGEPIGVARLLIRPTATLSIEAKERQEHFERIEGDD